MKFSEMPYTRVNLEDVENTWKNLIERAEQAESGEALFAVHQEKYRFMGDVQTNMTLAHIRHDIDTTDEFYTTENDYYDEIRPILENYETMYAKVLYESPHRAYMESKIGKVTFKNMELALKSFDEKLIPLMQEDNALISRYSKLIATAEIPFDGEIENLSLMMKYTRCHSHMCIIMLWK